MATYKPLPQPTPRLKHTLAIMLLIVVLLVFGGGISLYYHASNTTRTAGANGVGCTSHAHSAVVTFFYTPGTSSQVLHALITSVHGTVTDTYGSLHGYSIAVPAGTTRSATATLKAHPGVISATSSSAEECIDSD